MAEKRIKTRIIHKHAIESNWVKATNFVPKQGELIVYDIEVDEYGNTLTLPTGRDVPYAYERFKIGDGITLVSNLPFVSIQPDWNQTDETKLDYIKNKPTVGDGLSINEDNKIDLNDETVFIWDCGTATETI